MLLALLLAFAMSLLWVVVVAVGLRLLWAGIRGSRSGDEPRCGSCRYSLRGLSVRPEHCPECGDCLLGIGKITLGVRRPAPHIAVAGLALLALAAAPVGAMRQGRVAPVVVAAPAPAPAPGPAPLPPRMNLPPPMPRVMFLLDPSPGAPAIARSQWRPISTATHAAISFPETSFAKRPTGAFAPPVSLLSVASARDVTDGAASETHSTSANTLDLVLQLHESFGARDAPSGPLGGRIGQPFRPTAQRDPLLRSMPAGPAPIDRRIVREPRDGRVPGGRIGRRLR